MLSSVIWPCLHFIMKLFPISSLIMCTSHWSQQAPIRYSGSESFNHSLSWLSGFHLTLPPCQLSNGQSSSSVLRWFAQGGKGKYSYSLQITGCFTSAHIWLFLSMFSLISFSRIRLWAYTQSMHACTYGDNIIYSISHYMPLNMSVVILLPNPSPLLLSDWIHSIWCSGVARIVVSFKG